MFSFPDQYLWVRLDKALSDYYQSSRNLVQQVIQKKWVSIKNHHDGSRSVVKKSYQIQPDDCFQVPDITRFEDPWILAQSPPLDLTILHHTSDYLIIIKPKWVLTHPKTLWDVDKPSVVGWLYHRLQGLPSSWSFIRAWIVHRLDKDTDGLMIVALTEKGLSYFRDCFDRKAKAALDGRSFDDLHKYYRASCKPTALGTQWLQTHRSSPFPLMLDWPIYPKTWAFWYPKRGITLIRWREHTDDGRISVDIELLTGRTHQIRFHLAEIGLPIVWDLLYGLEKEKNKDTLTAEALQLTAYQLSFVDCDGVYQSFTL